MRTAGLMTARSRKRAAGPAKTRRTQEERRETTRRKLLEAATDCIARFGLANSSLDVIAKRASVTSGAVQHHFGTRNELLLAVVDEFGQQLFGRSGGPWDQAMPLDARIDRLCSQYWQTFSTPHFLAVIQIWFGVQSDPKTYRSILTRIRWFEVELDRQWIALFSDSAIGEKELRASRHVALGTMRGLALRMTYSRDRANSVAELVVLKTMLGKFLGRP